MPCRTWGRGGAGGEGVGEVCCVVCHATPSLSSGRSVPGGWPALTGSGRDARVFGVGTIGGRPQRDPEGPVLFNQGL